MNGDVDHEDLKRVVLYEYNRVYNSISHDWSAENPPVSKLEKQFVCLSNEVLEDGVFINETIRLENGGPVLENNLETVPLRFEKRMDLQQLMQSRLFKCT